MEKIEKILDKKIMKLYIARNQVSVLEEEDPVLKLNELIAVYEDDILIGHKIGDGVTKWSMLRYLDSFDVKEFWLYVSDADNNGYKVACKVFLDPKIDKDFRKYLDKDIKKDSRVVN
jgi:hypothetical protein